MTPTKTILSRLSLALFLVFSLAAGADEAVQGNPEGKGARRPPKEALEACAKKKAGDACTFTGGRKESVSGTCFTPDESKPLACKPKHPPEHERGGGRGAGGAPDTAGDGGPPKGGKPGAT